jgi:hypothetical protein
VSAPDRFIAWCKQEQASIEQQLELMETGKVRTGEDIGAESIERAKARLAELNDLLTEVGKATVVKPDALGPPQRRASCIGISQQWRVHLRWPFSDSSTRPHQDSTISFICKTARTDRFPNAQTCRSCFGDTAIRGENASNRTAIQGAIKTD